VCNTIGVEATAPRLFSFYTTMATQTSVPNEKLSVWYFAVRYSILRTEQTIKYSRELDLSTSYDELQLEQLRDLEQFLKMSWDVWMDDMGAVLLHAVRWLK
jgi:hypothetical protein